jgi:hypothetical protein
MPARYTVVYDRDVLQLLDAWTSGNIGISLDRDTFDHDLAFAPHTAGEQKASGYYVGRRGSIVLKYAVSDDDRIVRIIGAQLCSHPFYVDLSRNATDWLRSVHGTLEGELALTVFNQLLPSLRRDPRLVGVRIHGDDYLAQSGRITLTYRVIDTDCRVCVTNIRLTDS